MLHIPRAALAMLVASLVQALAAPGSPPGTTNTSAGPVTMPEVVVPIALPVATGLSQIARFENDAGIPRAGLPINDYMDIFWKGMSLAKMTTSLIEDLPGLVPNRPLNFASFSLTDNVTIEQGMPEMTTLYSDSTVTSFNLHAFFYGCESKADVPVPSSYEITITGFNSTGGQVNQQTFQFEVDGTQQQMPQAVAEGFSGVKLVKFEVGPEDNEATAFIDSVDYEVFGS